MFSPSDGPLLEMIAKWIEGDQTPSLLPQTHAKHLRGIAKEIVTWREAESQANDGENIDTTRFRFGTAISPDSERRS